MSNWVDKYLDKLLPGHTTHIIVNDIDGLLKYDELSQAVQDLGYSIIHVHSALEARIQFELEMRDSPRRVVLAVQFAYKPLSDMLMQSWFVTIGFKDLFPYFDCKALSGMSFNALCTLDELKPYDQLGYDGTVRFLLENLYHIDYEALKKIKTKERLLSVVADVIFHKDGVNPSVKQFLDSAIRNHIPELSKQELSSSTFLSFIQDKWNSDDPESESVINFHDPLFAKTIGLLFIQGLLNPKIVNQKVFDSVPLSLRCGFYVDKVGENISRFDSLTNFLESRIYSIQDQYSEWFELSPLLGEGFCLSITIDDSQRSARFNRIIQDLNTRFQKFIRTVYWQLYSLSGVRHPVVISRILDYIHAQPGSKKAIIVIDGMNLWQWNILHNRFLDQGHAVNLLTSFAYLPSITAWSRQALFRGSKPDLSKDNKDEDKYLKSYWESKNIQSFQSSYNRFGVKVELDPDYINDSHCIVSLVCNDLDELMHGPLMDNAKLFDVTSQWIEKSNILTLVNNLRQKGFICFITTDHGNIEATPIKNISLSVKNLSKSRSKRHIQFVDIVMMNDFIANHPELKIGFHESSVFLNDDKAFVSTGNIITHGGSHLMELLIPLGVIS